jgi:hypothetical protein
LTPAGLLKAEARARALQAIKAEDGGVFRSDKTPFDWEVGRPGDNLRNLDRMRTTMPDLYQSMQIQRNTWWAHKIDELLATDETTLSVSANCTSWAPTAFRAS